MQPFQINTGLLGACKSFAKDHFAHFGCMPMEFEFDNNVFDFDTYLEFLTQEDLDEITGQVVANSLYPLPEKDAYSGESFRVWKFGHFVPTYHQLRLYNAVFTAVIEQELTYNDEIYQFVIKELGDLLTPDLLARNSKTMRTERGFFGMEVYCMSAIVKSHESVRCNRDALLLLKQRGLKVGMTLKGPFKRSLETFSSVQVVGINELDGWITMHGKKRGSKNKWEFSVGASCYRLQDCFDNQ